MKIGHSSLEHWQTVFNLLPVAVVFAIEELEFTDKAGNSIGSKSECQREKYLYANESAYALLGLDPEHSLQSQLQKIHFSFETQSKNTEKNISPLLAGLAGESVSRQDLIFNNQALWLESSQYLGVDCHIYAVTLQSRNHGLFPTNDTPIDVSNAKKPIRELLQFETLITELSNVLLNTTSSVIDTDIQYALSQLGEYCQADRTYVFLFDFEHTAMSNSHEWVRQGISSHIDDLQNVSHHSLPWFFQQILRYGVVSIANTACLDSSAALEKKEFARENIQSMLCVGFYNQQELIGFIGIDMVARQRRWSKADVRRTRMIGELIATAINNERLLITLQTSQQQLRSNNDALRELVLRDGITGLANQRQFHERLHEESVRAQQQGHELSVVMFAIEHFLSYSQILGNEASDSLLIRIATLLQDNFYRHGELLARLNREHFAVIVPHLDVVAAGIRCKTFVNLVADQRITHPQHEQISIKFGVAALSECRDIQHMLSMASNRLTAVLTNTPNHVVTIKTREAL